MRVGLDIDGVTLDFHRALRERYETWFGVTPPEFKEWDDPLHLMHFETYSDLWDWCDHAQVWHDLPYVPGAPGAIDALLTAGHSVAFVTSRTNGAAAAAEFWHVESPWRRQTQLVTGLGNTKHQVPCSVYVDDSPFVIESLVDVGRKAIVFDRPWNAHLDVGYRAQDWSEVLDWIEELA
jgi:hypothetical protein